MKTGWKREESSIAAVCGGRLTGTQERVTQPTSSYSLGEAGEKRGQEQEEAGEAEHQRPGPGFAFGGGVASFINKALVSITVTAWAADLRVPSRRLRGHLVLGFLFTQV